MQKLLAGQIVDPKLVYFRTVPKFETAAPELQWLARSVFVGFGERFPTEVVVRFYRLDYRVRDLSPCSRDRHEQETHAVSPPLVARQRRGGRRRRGAVGASRHGDRAGARRRRRSAASKPGSPAARGPGARRCTKPRCGRSAGRQVLVRTEATNLCYTLVPAVLGLARRRFRRAGAAGGGRARAATQSAAHQRHGRDPRSRRRRHRRSRGPEVRRCKPAIASASRARRIAAPATGACAAAPTCVSS